MENIEKVRGGLTLHRCVQWYLVLVKHINIPPLVNQGEEKTADPATLKRPVTPLKIRPFPLGSPFLESIRLAEQLDSHGVDDSEIVTLPPPSSPVVGSDYYSQPSSGENA